MEFLSNVIDFVLHLDKHLDLMVSSYEYWTYAILFMIVFCETGFVVTPFLPGDSLLFAAGALAARPLNPLDAAWLVLLLGAAAILGDTANYWIGHWVGPKVFHKEKSRLLNKKHLERARGFYERHGGKTIIIARFVPIIRTFAPFVAGIGRMAYGRFIAFNVVGGAAWVAGFVLAGYFFGNVEFVRNNFSLVIIAIIFISVLPIVIEFIRHRFAKKRA